MANADLSFARRAKNDEFYTQWHDIEVEMMAYLDYDPDVFRGKTVLLPCDDPEWSNFTKFFAQNFDRFGLKKLISTSYAPASKRLADYRPSLFEQNSLQYDELKSQARGKIFVLDSDITGDGRINIDDLQWQYLEGDGDFRSDEVTHLRDEADIIVTNPPFSLFREFFKWLVVSYKQFIIIGNMNAITYKESFPFIKDNRVWLGVSNGQKQYICPNGSIKKMGNTCWFTNIDHGRRHQPLSLMTIADNLRFSKHKEIRGQVKYQQYENYVAIEVPFADAIPSDYDGIMGVPISFLDKYCPEQFEIIWRSHDIEWAENECDFYTPPSTNKVAIYKKKDKTWRVQIPYVVDNEGNAVVAYQRLFIRHKR